MSTNIVSYWFDSNRNRTPDIPRAGSFHTINSGLCNGSPDWLVIGYWSFISWQQLRSYQGGIVANTIGRTQVSREGDRGFEPMVDSNQ